MLTEKEDDEEYPCLISLEVAATSFRSGDTLLVHAKTSSEWWWAELQRGSQGMSPPATCASWGRGGGGHLWRTHEASLGDAVRRRTEVYRQVILSNSAPLRNKVVMDLGCGTGIVSLFCAQLARPSQVFAVEASSMAEYTRQLVKQNGCEEVVTVLQGRAEDIHLPERVDILLSEWMGNCLLAVSNNTSLSSWWSQFCWPGTAGLKKAA